MYKVLFAAAEAAPFAKSGGLGDVVGSLPKELKKQGFDIRVVVPKYSSIHEQFKSKMQKAAVLTVPVGWRQQYCGVEYLDYEGVPFYFIDNEYYFKRPNLYAYEDEAERYAYFTQAILRALPGLDFQPDIIHCHDWHTAMVCFCLKASFKQDPWYKDIKTVFTIHNLKYQGIFPLSVMGDMFFTADYQTLSRAEFDGMINFLKAGLINADKITTVSRSYAQEIKQKEYGERLEEILQYRQDDLLGIVNGIDYDLYNPQTDTNLHYRYDESKLHIKQDNKVSLQAELGLNQDGKVPLFGIVSRLVEPKGIDLILEIIEDILQTNLAQLIVLGTGERKYEDFFRNLAAKYPRQVAAKFQFDETLAHKIYAASDIYLMPSATEPCGISQMIALRYGTVPIVRETGGLKDTVQPFNFHIGEGNGFRFIDYSAAALLSKVRQALDCYHNKSLWSKIVLNAMHSDFSWHTSAAEYKKLYEDLLRH